MRGLGQGRRQVEYLLESAALLLFLQGLTVTPSLPQRDPPLGEGAVFKPKMAVQSSRPAGPRGGTQETFLCRAPDALATEAQVGSHGSS